MPPPRGPRRPRRSDSRVGGRPHQPRHRRRRGRWQECATGNARGGGDLSSTMCIGVTTCVVPWTAIGPHSNLTRVPLEPLQTRPAAPDSQCLPAQAGAVTRGAPPAPPRCPRICRGQDTMRYHTIDPPRAVGQNSEQCGRSTEVFRQGQHPGSQRGACSCTSFLAGSKPRALPLGTARGSAVRTRR